MKTPALLVAFACSAPFLFAAAAHADAPSKWKKGGSEEPKPIVGRAPSDEGKPSGAPKEPAQATKIFDTDELGTPDKASVVLIKSIEKKCFDSPLSREGMSEDQTKRCNAAVARLVGHGKAAIPGIIAALNERGDDAYQHDYARNRLYYALAKTDDPRVEDILLRGYARIATTQDTDYLSEVESIDAALSTMNGTSPIDATRPSDTADDPWKAGERSVFVWRLWQKAHASTPKAKVRSEALAEARRDVSSPDLKKQWVALSTLSEQAPSEAIDVLTKLMDRADLKDEDKQPSYRLPGRAYENGGRSSDALDAEEQRR